MHNNDTLLHMARIQAQHMEDDLECAERKIWRKHDLTHTHLIISGVSVRISKLFPILDHSTLINPDFCSSKSGAKIFLMSNAIPMSDKVWHFHDTCYIYTCHTICVYVYQELVGFVTWEHADSSTNLSPLSQTLAVCSGIMIMFGVNHTWSREWGRAEGELVHAWLWSQS